MPIDLRVEVSADDIIMFPERFFEAGRFRQYRVRGAFLSDRFPDDIAIEEMLRERPNYMCRIGSLSDSAMKSMPAYSMLTRSDLPCDMSEMFNKPLSKLFLSVTRVGQEKKYIFNITNVWM